MMYIYAKRTAMWGFPLLATDAADQVQVVGIMIKTGWKLAGL
jgi:hypothetical protein